MYNLTSFDICIYPWNHQHNQDNENSQYYQKFSHVLMLSLPLTCIPSPILRKPLMCCYHRLVFIFYGIIKYSLFGLVSFTDYVSILRVIYVFLCVSSSFFSLLSNIPLYGYTTICLFINMQVWIWVVSSLSLLQITIILFGFFVLIWSWPSETDCTTNVMHVID